MHIITPLSAPWQYALSPIPRVCRTPGAFSFLVPAAKLARREGMEFILDPLWQQVNDDLFEHIDALQSGLQRPVVQHGMATPAHAGPPDLSV